jgi:GH15 family glucan-1,4-alpha-glucosidase
MAKIFLKDFYIKNSTTQIVAVSWQVSITKDFSIINNESIFDTKNILEWDVGVLHYGTGKRLDLDNNTIYARVKIHSNDMGTINESDWFVAKLVDPTEGEKDITYDGKVISRIKDNKDGSYTVLY